MMVVRRKNGQKCIIAGGIVLTTLKVGKNKVKIAIDAPSHIKIERLDWEKEG